MNQKNETFTTWRKSSHSGDTGGQCVEVTALPGQVGVRDSKNPDAPHLTLTLSTFHQLTRRLRSEG
ncbi:DUF397 domain-containing protein [Actinocorallia populi]|uniref:DUF397 domain-containing protein n=1 Tax=Actinocorallia populi TaxID=2079200 RepID=UPI000D09704B|nr:DUF397 domain-containing protein [Actinocorallia populi]